MNRLPQYFALGIFGIGLSVCGCITYTMALVKYFEAKNQNTVFRLNQGLDFSERTTSDSSSTEYSNEAEKNIINLAGK